MVVVDLDELNLPYKIMPPNFIDESLEKHCNRTNCDDCKYDRIVPYETCRTAYIYGHNLMKIGPNEKYAIISDEERHFIRNQNIYCASGTCKSCSECRYTYLIYDKDGKTLGCAATRVIAHRIVTGEITRDQYILIRR